MRKAGMAALAAAIAAPASAEVVDASDAGFTSRHVLIVTAPPAKVWDALVHPDRWWEAAHSYSGDSASLSLDPRPGGCWCEKIPGGGVEHMRVIHVDAERMLRMAGGLGPLQAMPVSGVMTVTLEARGAGTEIVATYSVAGPRLAPLAAPVDKVLGAQWLRLKAAAER